LSFHIISQIGYLMMGLGVFTLLSVAGMIFFMVHVILAKSALFFVSGIIHQYQGSFHLKKLGGLYNSHLGLAVLFCIPAFALAGIPPLSGFWAKLTLVRAGLEAGQYSLVLVSLVVSMLTLFSMTKIWAEAFWKAKPEATPDLALERPARLSLLMPVILLVALLLVIGLVAEPLMAISLRAAEQLLNPAGYIAAVMGD
jgi:multicomponent Na+:H+ antiporter subunit D